MAKRLTADKKIELYDIELSDCIHNRTYNEIFLRTLKNQIYRVSNDDLSDRSKSIKKELLFCINELLKEFN